MTLFLRILIGLFTISCFSEFIANDKPLWVIHKPDMIILPLIPYHCDTIAAPALLKPSKKHWLGTDANGRDVLARLLYGFRHSLLFGLSVAILSSCVGLLIGSIQGYFCGRFDFFLQGLTQIWYSIPSFFILMMWATHKSFFKLVLIMSFFTWPSIANIVRAEFMKATTLDYVKSARALGVPTYKIFWHHIFPYAVIPVKSYFPFIVSNAITIMASLDFLGFGFELGTATLGDLIAQGKQNLHAPWLSIVGCLALSILLLLLILIGEDLKKKSRS